LLGVLCNRMKDELITNIDYSYIDRMVSNIRHSLKLRHTPAPHKGVVISIHVQSNRPDNFTQFLDDLEASIDDPKNIEVIVKIDDVDVEMNALLPLEIAKRPFTLKYISTPLDGGFFELWRSMNDILKVTDPDAYFLWNMNDEMAVLNKGWDTALKKYVGLFPDHIFRLRTSLFRFRNYNDFWENGFSPETSAINTKRWIEIGGNWNPCLGPDSFQQCVAYYFAYHGRFDKYKPLREVPVHDIIFRGEGANLGLAGEKLWRRVRGATKAWYRLMSYPIQLEASRRAQKLQAHISAYNNRLEDFSIVDNERKKTIILTDKETNKVIRNFPYKISRTRIVLTNILRSPYYLYYGGGAIRSDWKFLPSLLKFLALRYDAFEWLYRASKDYSIKKPRVKVLVFKRLERLMAAVHSSVTTVLKPIMPLIPGIIKRGVKSLANSAYTCLVNILNAGYPFTVLYSPYGMVVATMNWNKIDIAMLNIVFPERFNNDRYRVSVIRYLLLQHWHQLTTAQLHKILETNNEHRYFILGARKEALPSESAIKTFRDILAEEGALEAFYAAGSDGINVSALPSIHTSNFLVRQAAA